MGVPAPGAKVEIVSEPGAVGEGIEARKVSSGVVGVSGLWPREPGNVEWLLGAIGSETAVMDDGGPIVLAAGTSLRSPEEPKPLDAPSKLVDSEGVDCSPWLVAELSLPSCPRGSMLGVMLSSELGRAAAGGDSGLAPCGLSTVGYSMFEGLESVPLIGGILSMTSMEGRTTEEGGD